MASWTSTVAQCTDSSTVALGSNPTDHVWFNSTTDKNGNIVVNSYQDYIHIYDSGDTTHRCSAAHVHNVKPLTSTTYSLNGGGSVALDATHPATTECPFKFIFSDGNSVQTSAATFYFYNGTTDATGMVDVLPQAIERGNTAWPNFATTGVNGSGAALSLADQATPATTHNFYIAVAVAPTQTGAKTVGKMKIVLTYI